jgi:DNA-binding transcriptional LysR family regulator
MEFRHLTYFVAVAGELHFRRAAERLHIAQPALSQQIARLEAELGVELLARTKRSVALTDAGRVFLDDARELLEKREQAVVRAQRAAAGHDGVLRAGFVGPAIYTVLHTVVRSYRAAYPDVSLTLHELPTGQQIDRLLSGALDVGLVRLPLAHERITTAGVMSEPIVAVLPEDHRLSGASVIDLAALAPEPFVMVPRSREPAAFDRYVGLCAAAGFSPRIVQEAEQIHTIVELVGAGLGIALGPASLANLHRPGVVYRPISAPAGSWLHTGIAWRSDNSSALVQAFVRAAVTAGGLGGTPPIVMPVSSP